jgi:hypothetical protein
MPTPRIHRLPKKIYLGPDKPEIIITILPALEFASKVTSNAAGAWIKEESTIYLRSDFSLTRCWVAFREELTHALIDLSFPLV